MKYINLPSIPDDLLADIKETATRMTLEPSTTEYLNEYYGNEYNIADFVVFQGVSETNKVLVNESIVQRLKDLYEPVFGCKVYPTLARQVNINPPTLATVGPHCDRFRTVGINYILDLGGNNVITKTYKNKREDHSNLDNSAETKKFEDVTFNLEYKLPKDTWFVFNPQQYHSVHNLESTRVLLFLLWNTSDYDEFVNKYNHLLVDITPLR